MSYNFTKEQIEDAFENAHSASGAARLLGVKINTYKRYAVKYNCYKTNQSGKGMPKNRPYTEDENINIHYFDVVDTTDKAYILGYLLADGTIKGNRVLLHISSKDREILEYICSKLNVSIDKIVDYTGWYKNDSGRHNFPCSQLSINSKHIVNTLGKYGLIINRIKKGINLFEHIPDNMMMSCLAGYIDGNGCLGKKSSEISVSSNLITCDIITNYIKQFGIIKTHIKIHEFFGELIFRGNDRFVQAYLNSNEFLLTRKKERAKSMLLRINKKI